MPDKDKKCQHKNRKHFDVSMLPWMEDVEICADCGASRNVSEDMCSQWEEKESVNLREIAEKQSKDVVDFLKKLNEKMKQSSCLITKNVKFEMELYCK